MRYLIHDHDAQFAGLYATVFESQRIEFLNIPYEAPNANAVAERWVRSVGEECLDHLIILNERHLCRVLSDYVTYYNAGCPHRGIQQDRPLGLTIATEYTLNIVEYCCKDQRSPSFYHRPTIGIQKIAR
jgi:hypothetical protein